MTPAFDHGPMQGPPTIRTETSSHRFSLLQVAATREKGKKVLLPISSSSDPSILLRHILFVSAPMVCHQDPRNMLLARPGLAVNLDYERPTKMWLKHQVLWGENLRRSPSGITRTRECVHLLNERFARTPLLLRVSMTHGASHVLKVELRVQQPGIIAHSRSNLQGLCKPSSPNNLELRFLSDSYFGATQLHHRSSSWHVHSPW